MRILFIYTFISIIILFTSNNAASQDLDTSEIKLLSWNAYMLPAFPIFTHQKKRAKGMVEVLKNGKYDVICFQEAYHKGFRKIILKGLKEQYPFQIGEGDKEKSAESTKGLWILSKRPINKIKEIKFKDKIGLEKYVSKGAILFEMDGIKNLHFINTHFQSADGIGETAVRKGQSLQIQEELVEPFIDQKKTVLFAGDWNMEAGSAFDNFSLTDLLKITHPKTMPTTITWPSETFRKTDGSHVLDLGMLYCPNDQVSDFETGVPNLKYEWKKDRNDLSDHMPIEVIFKISK